MAHAGAARPSNDCWDTITDNRILGAGHGMRRQPGLAGLARTAAKCCGESTYERIARRLIWFVTARLTWRDGRPRWIGWWRWRGKMLMYVQPFGVLYLLLMVLLLLLVMMLRMLLESQRWRPVHGAAAFIRAINDKLERPNEIWRDLPTAFISRGAATPTAFDVIDVTAETCSQSAAECGSVAMPTGRRLAAAGDRLLPRLLLMLIMERMVEDCYWSLMIAACCAQRRNNDTNKGGD